MGGLTAARERGPRWQRAEEFWDRGRATGKKQGMCGRGRSSYELLRGSVEQAESLETCLVERARRTEGGSRDTSWQMGARVGVTGSSCRRSSGQQEELPVKEQREAKIWCRSTSEMGSKSQDCWTCTSFFWLTNSHETYQKDISLYFLPVALPFWQSFLKGNRLFLVVWIP